MTEPETISVTLTFTALKANQLAGLRQGWIDVGVDQHPAAPSMESGAGLGSPGLWFSFKAPVEGRPDRRAYYVANMADVFRAIVKEAGL